MKMSCFMKTLLFISLLLASAAEADIASVVIDEIHYDPDVKTELVEFVELYNAGTTDVDLSGWYFSNGISFQFPDDAILPAGGYVVATEDPYPAYQPTTIIDKYGADSRLVYGPFAGRLSNEGERIVLRDAEGVKVDEVDYRLGFPWPTVGDAVPENQPGTGRSIQLVNPFFDNDLAGSWRSAYPTPAARNEEVYAENIPPHIRQVKHSPKQPKSNEVVTITAKATDADGVAEVTLIYQLVDPGSYIPLGFPNYTANPYYENPANWSSIPMHDDGLNGDEMAGDDIYTVQLPASLQVHRRLVRYRIRITDDTLRFLIVPYSDDPQPNFAYFVYDGVPAWSAAIKPGDQGQLGQIVEFGTEVMRSLPVYHFIANAQDVQNCQYNRSYENVRFCGTLVYDGAVYDHVEYKIRGEVSTYVSGKNKWKFFFTRGHDFQARDNYRQKYNTRWRVMNLSAGAVPWVPNNRGMGGMDEVVAYALYNLVGVPSPKTHFLQFRIIDDAVEADPSNQYEGDLWGLYLAIEHPDGRFLDEYVLPDGNIYKLEGQGDKKNQGPTQTVDASDLTTFRNGCGWTNTVKWWKENLNLQRYYSFRALNRVVNNMDLRDRYNVYYYHDPQTNLWTAIPWDMDMLYCPCTHWSGVLNIQNCLSHPELRIGYQNRGRELQDLLLTVGQLGQIVDELAAFINPPDQPWTIVDVDRFMWDYNPRTTSPHRGVFYRNPAESDPWAGRAGHPGVLRTLVSADHEGMMQWIKDFMLPGPGGSSSPSSYGADFLNSEVFDSAIPDVPTIAYTGSADYPINDLTFKSSSFSDPQGSGTFKAIRWRIAEVESSSEYVSPPCPDEMITLLELESPDWKYYKGDAGEPSGPVDAWRQLNFDDSSWYEGQTSIGYGDSDDNTILNDMQNNYSTIYLRHKFTVTNVNEIETLKLRVYVDDGCIIWINGTEVARLNVSNSFKAYDDLTDAPYVDDAVWQEFELSPPYDYLVEEENIIAIHVLNSSLNSSDISMDVTLIAETDIGGDCPDDSPASTYTYRSRPGKYEIDEAWESEELTEFDSTITIPASVVQPGRTYRVRCRMKDKTGRWSHWSEPVQFVAGEPLQANILNELRITEIMYNPADADVSRGEMNVDNDEFEFIELKNIGNETLDLTYVSFIEGISFDFASGNITSLDGGDFVLVIKNIAAFEPRYGTGVSNKIAGEYSGKLANEGEKISLVDIWNGIIAEFEYSDDSSWPQSADGAGYSLVPLTSSILGELDGSLNDGGNWRASTNIDGSPGRDDP